MKTKRNNFFPLQPAIIAPVLISILLAVTVAWAICIPQPDRTVTITGGDGNGIISGVVTDAKTGNPIGAARLALWKDNIKIMDTTSDQQGRFSFQDIIPGSYLVRAEVTGFVPFQKKTLAEKDRETIVSVKLIKEKPESKNTTGQTRSLNKQNRAADAAGGVMAEYMSVPPSSCQPSAYAYDQTYQDFNTESYDKINENNFREVVNDPLSTFSIDVDKASYSNVRRFLNNNTLPYKDAVRIEELINYFDYTYPQPTDGTPFSVSFSNGDCPWKEGHKLVLIGIKGKEMQSAEIPAGNFVFLIDVSGSMDEPDKLPLIKQAFRILVNNLRSSDRIALVVYAGAAGVVLESTPGNEKEKILGAIDMLQAGGCTAGGAGINLAYKIAKQNYIPGGNNRVILATDGDFNIGASSDAEMTRLIEEKRKEGVFISVLGFGMGNYKDSKMEKIADAGNGNYAYIDNILEAKKMFGQELWGTLYTIAKDVKIQVEFNPAKVKAYRLIGYENRILNKEDFNNDKKDAGDIGAGHTVTALYEIVLNGTGEKFPTVDPLEYQTTTLNGSNNLMTVKLRYKDPADTTSKLLVRRIKESDIGGKITDSNLKFASAVAAFGMLLRDSEFKGTASYEMVIALSNEARGEDRYGYRQDFVRLAETASLLARK